MMVVDACRPGSSRTTKAHVKMLQRKSWCCDGMRRDESCGRTKEIRADPRRQASRRDASSFNRSLQDVTREHRPRRPFFFPLWPQRPYGSGADFVQQTRVYPLAALKQYADAIVAGQIGCCDQSHALGNTKVGQVVGLYQNEIEAGGLPSYAKDAKELLLYASQPICCECLFVVVKHRHLPV